MARRADTGLTRVEIAVVVILLAILVAIVIPMFGGYPERARQANLMANLQTVRRQLSLYRAQHGNQWPGAAGGADAFVRQMTACSDADGNTSPARSADFPHGPYLSGIPANAVSGDDSVLVVKPSAVFVPPAADAGWWYNPGTGTFRANLTNAHALPDGRLVNQF